MLVSVLALALAAPGFGARVDLGVTLPISAPQATYFTPGPGGALTGELGLLPFLDVEVQLSYLLLPRTEASPTTGSGTVLGIGAGVRLHRVISDSLLVPWGEALVSYGASGGSRLPLTVSAGLSFKPMKNAGFLFGVFARLQHVFALAAAEPGYATYDATLLSFGVSLEFFLAPPPPDGDGDGFDDAADDCPLEAGPERGCPASVRPPPPPVDADSDKDGVPDALDRCVDAAEDKDHYQDEDGCPDLDDDADGVPDAKDACPKASGALNGCPDTDGDGVADREDACPRVKGLPADKGCPKYKDIVVTDVKLEIKQKIFFAFGTTKILPKSDPLLDEVATVLKDRPAICVRIEGHTDNKGAKEANLALSTGRAEAVRDALAGRGLDDTRMVAQGYGQTLPIDSNGTLEGRENNRRVEFVIIPCVAEAP